MSGPEIAWLAGGRRLHLNHGPIDLVVEAFAAEPECRAAYRAAIGRFGTILEELVAELPELRRPAGAARRRFDGPTARRMERAVQRYHPQFITPMAAVAGAVADEVLAAMTAAASLDKAYVNDGGDIAIHLSGDATIAAAIAGTGHGFADRLIVHASDPVRGIATSGWRGRSFSLGIADAVTALAADAASADAAATIIANAVDLPGHHAVLRRPADEMQPDTDLGSLPVTVDVGRLSPDEVALALDRGAAAAQMHLARGLVHGCAIFLAGEARLVGNAAAARDAALAPSLRCGLPTLPRLDPHRGEEPIPRRRPFWRGSAPMPPGVGEAVREAGR